jgi:hypothetical protein
MNGLASSDVIHRIYRGVLLITVRFHGTHIGVILFTLVRKLSCSLLQLLRTSSRLTLFLRFRVPNLTKIEKNCIK